MDSTTFAFFYHDSSWWMRVTNSDQLKAIIAMDRMDIDKSAEELMQYYTEEQTNANAIAFCRNASALTKTLYVIHHGSGLTLPEAKEQLLKDMTASKVNALLEHQFINVNCKGGWNTQDWPLTGTVIVTTEPSFPQDPRSNMSPENQE